MCFTIFGFTISWPLVGVLFALVLGREIWNVTYMKRLGIPGPTAIPFIGNTHQIGKDFHVFLDEAHKKYGKVVGFFMFRDPAISISDPDMLKDISIKNFSKFQNHFAFALKNKPFDQGLDQLRDQHWKSVRNVITPTFSALKMKQMSPLINDCCDNLVRNMGQIQGKENEVNVTGVFEAFTMDGIAKCAFGLQVDSQNNADDPFVKNAKGITNVNPFSLTTLLAGICTPFAHLFNFLNIGMFSSSVINFFHDVVKKSLNMRKEASGNERIDFLQLIANAHEEDNAIEKTKQETSDHELHSMIDEHHNTSFHEVQKTQKVKLTHEEVFAQAMLFFIAGYETTNIALSFVSYSLATNPDVQEKLFAEIEENAPTRESVHYNSVTKMPYLDCVVCESLRMYPPAALTDRVCNETVLINGVKIEKGRQVMYPIFSVHRDPDTWKDPETFDPSRFTKENRGGRHPFAWLPFGSGPRVCVGMRFALLEIKMAVVRLLQKYRLETSPSTQIPPKLGSGIGLLKPEGGIILRLVERN